MKVPLLCMFVPASKKGPLKEGPFEFRDFTAIVDCQHFKLGGKPTHTCCPFDPSVLLGDLTPEFVEKSIVGKLKFYKRDEFSEKYFKLREAASDDDDIDDENDVDDNDVDDKAEREAAEAKAKAEQEAAEATAKAEREAAEATAKAEQEAAEATAKAEQEAAEATAKADPVVEPVPVLAADDNAKEDCLAMKKLEEAVVYTTKLNEIDEVMNENYHSFSEAVMCIGTHPLNRSMGPVDSLRGELFTSDFNANDHVMVWRDGDTAYIEPLSGVSLRILRKFSFVKLEEEMGTPLELKSEEKEETVPVPAVAEQEAAEATAKAAQEAAEATAKAEQEAAEAKAKAEREAAEATAKAEQEAAEATAKADQEAADAKAKAEREVVGATVVDPLLTAVVDPVPAVVDPQVDQLISLEEYLGQASQPTKYLGQPSQRTKRQERKVSIYDPSYMAGTRAPGRPKKLQSKAELSNAVREEVKKQVKNSEKVSTGDKEINQTIRNGLSEIKKVFENAKTIAAGSSTQDPSVSLLTKALIDSQATQAKAFVDSQAIQAKTFADSQAAQAAQAKSHADALAAQAKSHADVQAAQMQMMLQAQIAQAKALTDTQNESALIQSEAYADEKVINAQGEFVAKVMKGTNGSSEWMTTASSSTFMESLGTRRKRK